MDMGDMSMGSGIPSLNYLQQVYWAAVGAVIAAFFLANVYTKVLCWQRYVPPHINASAVLTFADEPLQPDRLLDHKPPYHRLHLHSRPHTVRSRIMPHHFSSAEGECCTRLRWVRSYL